MRERTAVKVARFVPGRGERVIFPSYSTVGQPLKDGVFVTLRAPNVIKKSFFKFTYVLFRQSIRTVGNLSN